MTSEAIESWLESQRITNISDVLSALHKLGATELSDLLDLSEDDLSTFQPPFLKSLEFKRFTRGITNLKNNHLIKFNVIQYDDAHVSDTSLDADANHFNNNNNNPIKEQEEKLYPRPALPSKCPTKSCDGVLILHLGRKKSKYLSKLRDTPDSRWFAECNSCSKKWHCCHFSCGKLQKISSMGSSEIIRHEQGRINRWQKKIQLPCSQNPQFHVLKERYEEQMKVIKKNDANSKDTSPSLGETEESFSVMNDFPNDVFRRDISADDSFDDDLYSILGPHYDDGLEVDILAYNESDQMDDLTISNTNPIAQEEMIPDCATSTDLMTQLCTFMNDQCFIRKGFRAMKKKIGARQALPQPKKPKLLTYPSVKATDK